MSFVKGRAKTGGRKKGVGNRQTTELRAMIMTALNEVGGVDYLVEQARKSPVGFMGLIKAILPKDVTVSGQENGEPITIRIRGLKE